MSVPAANTRANRNVRITTTPHEIYRFSHEAATRLLLLFCAVIGSPREPLRKGVAAVPRPQSARLCPPCCKSEKAGKAFSAALDNKDGFVVNAVLFSNLA